VLVSFVERTLLGYEYRLWSIHVALSSLAMLPPIRKLRVRNNKKPDRLAGLSLYTSGPIKLDPEKSRITFANGSLIYRIRIYAIIRLMS
jgi:hypothetical protein